MTWRWHVAFCLIWVAAAVWFAITGPLGLFITFAAIAVIRIIVAVLDLSGKLNDEYEEALRDD